MVVVAVCLGSGVCVAGCCGSGGHGIYRSGRCLYMGGDSGSGRGMGRGVSRDKWSGSGRGMVR